MTGHPRLLLRTLEQGAVSALFMAAFSGFVMGAAACAIVEGAFR